MDAGSAPTSHARSVSVDTQFPLSPESSKNIANTRFERPPPLQLASLAPYEGSLRPSSPESYLPTPDESVSSTDDDHTAVLEGSQQNGEGSSTCSYRDRRPAIVGKKGLPGVRPSLVECGTEDQAPITMSDSTRHATGPRVKDTAKVDASIPSPLSHRQDSSSSDVSLWIDLGLSPILSVMHTSNASLRSLPMLYPVISQLLCCPWSNARDRCSSPCLRYTRHFPTISCTLSMCSYHPCSER